MKSILAILFFLFNNGLYAQQTRFEKTNGKETATYFEAVKWYQDLSQKFKQVTVKKMGETDAGYPLHLVMVSNDKKFNPVKWHAQNKVVILINNGIHPGEPDGIDASMMLARDILISQLLKANVMHNQRGFGDKK